MSYHIYSMKNRSVNFTWLAFWCFALIYAIHGMEVNEIPVTLQNPRMELSWNAQPGNPEYRLIVTKKEGVFPDGLNEPMVQETTDDSITMELEHSSTYSASLLQRATSASPFTLKDNANFTTPSAPSPVTDDNLVKILVLYSQNASFYQIIARRLTSENNNVSSLPSTDTIPQQDLVAYNPRSSSANQTRYITLNITQSEMVNRTHTVFTVGDASTNRGLQNAELLPGNKYTFFQRTFFNDANDFVSHSWAPVVTIANINATTTTTTTINTTTTSNVTTPTPTNSTIGEASDGDDDEAVIISISVLIGVIVVILFMVFCCHWKYSRNYAPKPVKKKRTDPVQRQSTDPGIPVTENDFYDHVAQMKFHNFKGFYEEFTKMEVGFKPTEEFRNPENNDKNRFVNVPCYDHSRVKISPRKDENTYIHANFVPGFETERDYILTHAPMPETVKHFWSMIWDHDVTTIVMIGQMTEKGNHVCAPYFPVKEGAPVTSLYGEVHLEHEHRTADYVIRTLSLKSEDLSHSKRVKHFQFLSWPAVRITPACPTVFLQFMKAVNKSIGNSKGQNPIVIHGTTGTGRPGIYACVDTQIRRIKKQGDVNVYNAVLDVRETRYDGVKTLDEYIFIHDTVLEWILKKNIQDIDVEYLPHYIENINKQSPAELFKTEYSFLAATVVSAAQKMDVANQPCNKSKNRYDFVKPFDDNRVKLTKLVNTEGSDYINASIIDTYAHKKCFIATQAPLVGTVADFWRMIYENESWVIVMLGQEIEKGQLKADRFWPEEGYVMALGNLTIKFISFQSDALRDVVIRQVELANNKTNEKKLVQIYQYLTWPSHEGITSESIHSLVQLVHQSQVWKTKLQAKTITVVSSSGIGRPGVFIALRYLQEESETEGYVNIFQAVQKLRQQRPSLIQTREEYILIYTSTMEITKHVRRKSIVAESLASVDISTIGLNIVPNSVTDSENGTMMERLNSMSKTSNF